MEEFTAENLIEWVVSSNIFLHSDIGILKPKLETMLADLSSTKSNKSDSIIDSNQQKLILGAADIYLIFCSYQLSKGHSGKARSLLDKTSQLLSVLQSAPGQIGNVNIHLRHTLLSSLLNRKSPEMMLSILLKHAKEYQAKGVEKYPLAIYQFLISVIYLQMGNKSSFYNRVNTLRDTLHRLLHMKQIIPITLFVETVVCTKVTPFANPILIKAMAAASLLFDLQTDIDHPGQKKVAEGSEIKLANADIVINELPSSFQAVMQDFKTSIKMKLLKKEVKPAVDTKGNNYVVKVQSTENSKVLLQANGKKSKFNSKVSSKGSSTGRHSKNPSLSNPAGITKAGIYCAALVDDNDVVGNQRESGAPKKGALPERSEVRFDEGFLKRAQERMQERSSADVFRVSTENTVTSRTLTFGKLLNSHRASLTEIENDFHKIRMAGTNEGSLKEGSLKDGGSITKRFEWSGSTALGFMSSRRFTYTNGVQLEGSRESTTYKSKTHRSNKGSLGGDLKIHSNYYTQIKTFAENSEKTNQVKEFPEGLPMDSEGKIVVGRSMKHSRSGIFGSDRLFTESAEMLSKRPTFTKHSRVQSAFGMALNSEIDQKIKVEDESKLEEQTLRSKSGANRPLSARMSTVKLVYGLHKRSLTKQEGSVPLVQEVSPTNQILTNEASRPHETDFIQSSIKNKKNELINVESAAESKDPRGQGYLESLISHHPSKRKPEFKVVRQSLISIGNKKAAASSEVFKRRQTTHLDREVKAQRAKITPFQVRKSKKGDSVSYLLGSAQDKNNLSTLKKHNPRISYPIAESRNEMAGSDDEMLLPEVEIRRSESLVHSNSFKTNRSLAGAMKKKNHLKLPGGGIYTTESDFGVEGEILKSPKVGTPHHQGERSRFAKLEKSVSDRSLNPIDESKGRDKILQDSHLKARVRKSHTELHQGSLKSSSGLPEPEAIARPSRQSSLGRDELLHFKADMSKFKSKADLRKDLLEQLEYDSQASSESGPEKEGRVAGEKSNDGVLTVLRDFSAPQFRFLRLVKGAEALNRFAEKRKARTGRMVLFVLHFFSLRFKGERARPEQNSSTRDLTEYQKFRRDNEEGEKSAKR